MFVPPTGRIGLAKVAVNSAFSASLFLLPPTRATSVPPSKLSYSCRPGLPFCRARFSLSSLHLRPHTIHRAAVNSVVISFQTVSLATTLPPVRVSCNQAMGDKTGRGSNFHLIIASPSALPSWKRSKPIPRGLKASTYLYLTWEN